MKGSPKLATTVLVSFALICACATIDHASGPCGTLSGMLYDYENKPVYGYEIAISPIRKTITDINGHFSFTGVFFGNYDLKGSGIKHCSIETKVRFFDPREIIYIRVPSIDWIYCKVDEDIAKRKLSDARKRLASLPKNEKKTFSYRLYSMIAIFLESKENDLWKAYFKAIIPGRNRNEK